MVVLELGKVSEEKDAGAIYGGIHLTYLDFSGRDECNVNEW